ncbi:MAG: DUF58 domain-containing protein [Bacilli bacterium]|nr:DUF58 domain-containing protein [Bacilli bacterium]
MIKLNYINRIKARLSIHSNKKSTNVLEGTYKSIYRGKSMNFENLREYTIDDDMKDIDWKSSARSGNLLVKQFIAEKKHNILLVMDSGIKMDADTDKQENKKELALYTAGSIGYLAIKNNDYVGMIYKEKGVEFKPFKYNLYNLEEYLCAYAATKTEEAVEIEELLEYIVKNIPKKKVVFIITDIAGVNSISRQTLKQLKQTSDIFVISINDHNMTGDSLYDVKEKNFIPKIFLKDQRLATVEKYVKSQLWETNHQKLKALNIPLTSISSLDELTIKITKLLEEHKYE